ncbi:MAG: 50S ribosomal protein L11 methyltransferase [Deltaproteobacteria bacterium]|nr:50S ribosomal protein L11 methyltransferase [Deltaproteobacteria bacterium]
MQFEISIEGPFRAISRLNGKLDSFSPVMKRIPMRGYENREKGRIIIVASSEDILDQELSVISGIVTETERALSLDPGFDIRVRNLAYSEPSAGSSQFAEPFNPIPSITIQPWGPELALTTDPKTIIIDPHHAFGTGKHPSTLLCLTIMNLMAKDTSQASNIKGCKVLDFGCGTGLLAIAAIKMGAETAMGVEIDAQAARAAKNNVGLNRLSQRVDIREGSWEVVNGKFDLVLANLVASVLLRTGKLIPGHLTPSGAAVISGFGENQARDMKSFFEEQGLTVTRQFTHKGWSAFTMNIK